MDTLLQQVRAALAQHYTVEHEIGRGGMATVFAARDLKHPRAVAIKVLHREIAAMLGPERFLREVRITSSFTHPHILPLLDSGEAGGFLYYVMPYVEGESLRERLAREKQLPVPDAIEIACDVARALEYAHGHSIVHRDIKPENLLLEEGEAVVADFGIARALDAAGGPGLTETGQVIGTPAYMSPEQSAGEKDLDERSDLYSLGCVLYEMLAGRPPFTGPTAESVENQHRHATPTPLGSIRPGIPPELEVVVMRALAKTPADRCRSAAEMAAVLAAVLPATSMPTPATPRRTFNWPSVPRVLQAATVVGVIVIAVAVAIGVRDCGPHPPNVIAVMPFTVRGDPSLDYLSEGMVTLLATTLDGAGDLRAVDPRALLTFAMREKLRPGDMDGANAVARKFGAGLVVMGDVMRIGDGVRMQADLYDSRKEMKRLSNAEAAGDPDTLSGIIDRLAAGIVAAHELGAAGRLRQVAAVTTVSMPALKAYLEGEHFQRLASYARATRSYQRAIDLDSTFALAWYGLSQITGFPETSVYGNSAVRFGAAERAVELSPRLPPRERDIVRAWLAWNHGEVDQADSLVQSVLVRYPDDLEANLMLMDIYGYASPKRARSWREVRKPASRALALDSRNSYALWMLFDFYAETGDSAAADSIGRRLLQLVTDPDDQLVFRAHRVFYIGDVAEQEQVASEIREAAPGWTGTLARNVLLTSYERGNFDDVDRFFSLMNRDDAGIAMIAPCARLARGHCSESVVPGNASSWTVGQTFRRAYLALCSFVPGSAAKLRDIRHKVEAVEPVVSYVGEFRLTGPRGFTPPLRTYLLGLLSVRLGEPERALGYARDLDQMAGTYPEDARSMARDGAASIRAALLWRQDRPLEAMDALNQAPMKPWMRGTNGFSYRVHGRYLRAELLHALGRDAEARPWYETIGHISQDGIPYVAPAAFRLGEIAEAAGDRAEAVHHYSRFIELWKNCDPELRPQVEEARKRVARLMAKAG